MKQEEVFEEIKKSIHNKEITEIKFYEVVHDIFLKHMGYEKNYHMNYDDEKKGIYQCDVRKKF